MDEPLRRTLAILYDDWFRYESLFPRAMWLVELAHSEGPHDSGDSYSWPLRAFFIDHFQSTERSVFEWRRFYLSQWTRSWHVGQESPRRDGPRPRVYEIGLASFARNPETDVLTVDMTFGPLYGRGYELKPNGEITSVWAS